MPRLLAKLAIVAALTLSSLGCSDAPPLTNPDPHGEQALPIINGTPDTTHHAVVLVASGNTACTGTIVHKDGSNGFVLTAAHCGVPQYVLQGNDYNNPDYTYVVVDYLAHPNYNNQVYDFMMVRFTGAGSVTPVIPAMSSTEDNLTQGTQLRHVGYGKAGPAPGSPNTVRRQIVNALSSTAALTLDYNQPNGGPCSGDSGGPALTLSNERVAGVTAYGDQNCSVAGVAGRVSAVYDSFIMAYINNTPIGGMNCEQCSQTATTGAGDCMTEVNACLAHADCNALLACFETCTTNACYQQCANDHPSGANVYFDIPDCICDTACMTECSGEPMCQGGGATTAAAVGSGAVAASTSAGDAVTGAGGGDPVAGAGGATTGSDAWHAGNAQEQDYEGDVLMSVCSLQSGVESSGSRRFAGWSLALCVAMLVVRRRRT